MYANHHQLDTPPPPSQFRRPWSPVEADDYFGPSARPFAFPAGHREPSDPSVEALDLADYAHRITTRPYTRGLGGPGTLHGGSDPYTPFAARDPYPPSPPPTRPLASLSSARTPSLATPSQQTSGSSSYGVPRTPARRPFSLPAASSARTRGAAFLDDPYAPGRQPHAVGPDEVDISSFPAFSRGWYTPPAAPSHASKNTTASAAPSKPDFFDPGYISSPYTHDAHTPYPRPTVSSQGGHSGTFLPWGADPPENGPPIDEDLRAERMRMLEREFGGSSAGNFSEKDRHDGEERVVGSVDQKGNLITVGPKKRTATRFMQILLSLLVAGTSIYAAVIMKPKEAPPPRGTPQTYVMYVLSVLSTLAATWLFVFRPCCCGPRRKERSPVSALTADGMMVLPVQHMPGAGKDKKTRKGGKKAGKAEGGDVQVNLIVDPAMFGRGEHDHESSSSDEGEGGPTWDGSQWVSSSSGRHRRRRRGPRRRGVVEGLALEASWRAARAELKRTLVFDIVALTLWSAEFVYVLVGERCPVGGYEGWCNAYNTATAGTCFAAFAFGLSIFFDIKDLHSSRVSPRTRV